MRTNKPIFPFFLLTSVLLAGCGGSDGNGDESPPPPPPPPAPSTVTVDVADTAVDEGDSGSTDTTFTVSLSDAAQDEVTVDYATADASAAAGSDYTASSGTLTLAAGDTEATITVSVLGDGDVEADETFTVTLTNPSANATLGAATATATIANDDVPPASAETGLNDTGVTGCSTAIADQLSCDDPIDGTDEYPRQDGEYGRDFSARDDVDGRAGFAFLKLDAAGELLADQAASYAAEPWDCVEDAVTGLIWQVHSAAKAADTYSWRNTSGVDDGGDPGAADGGDCAEPGGCDTEAYAAAVNASAPCGIATWRLPKRGELLSLTDYGGAAAPLIDSAYFPNVPASAHWTADPDPRGGVRGVDFTTGESRAHARASTLSVLLVSSGGVQ